MPEVEFETLIDLVEYRRLHQAEQRSFTFLANGELEAETITFEQLATRARAIASGLLDLATPGECVLLLYPPGLEFIVAFLGCLFAGMIAVPAYPPKRNQRLSRLEAIVADAQPTVALTTRSLVATVKECLVQDLRLATMSWLVSDNIDSDRASEWMRPALGGDALAFLQYTSGSTGTPKGVMVSHRNVVHNQRMIQRAFQHTEQTIFVGWLPLYHDMGLIGNILQPLHLGIPCFLMSPLDFLQRPYRWLQAISRYGATTSGGPNFAYDLCVEKITPEQRGRLDLSTWEVAFNGAEPIRAQTLERFAAYFAPCGFRKEALYPCYGLAEATLFVSGGLKGRAPVLRSLEASAWKQSQTVAALSELPGIRAIVSCGWGWLDQRIVVVDPDSSTPCSEGQVGEIWIAGPNIAQGYWNRAPETKQTFRGYLTESGGGPFLRTGDLGFIQDDELFITGRIKDVIIIRGLNHYPQDIEQTVEGSHPALRPNCGAVFLAEMEAQERLVVVQEVKRDQLLQLDIDEVVTAISQAVSLHHGLQVYATALIKPSDMPKTSSGKIQRQVCRARFLAGTLQTVGYRSGHGGRGRHRQPAPPGSRASE